MEEVKGSEKFYPAQLCLLALGFLGPQSEAVKAFGVDQDARTNIKTAGVSLDSLCLTDSADGQGYATNVPGIFAAGDCRRGQSLVVSF